MPSQVVQPGWASQLVGVEAEAPGEQYELPVRLDLLDGVVGGVAVDDFQHRHLVVAAAVAGYGLEADVAAVTAVGVLQPAAEQAVGTLRRADVLLSGLDVDQQVHALHGAQHLLPALREGGDVIDRDRKSTRLNSSHANISYAVFCLKKKKHHPSTPD